MRQWNRRQFLGASLAVFGAGWAGFQLSGCRGKAGRQGEFTWRFAICNEIMKDLPWEKQCALAAEAGYQGIEIAPFTLADHVDELSAARRAEMRKAAEDAGIQIVGLHWLLVSPKGLHFTTPDEEVRQRTWDYVAKLVDFCADLGGRVMVFGSPKQRNATNGLSREQAMQNLIAGLKYVAPHASERGVSILIEPLDRSQTDVVNTLAEALEVVKAVNHPAVQTMFDFHNTPDETEPHEALIRKYFPYIRHVHVQEMDGTYLGTGSASKDYVPAFRALKELGYRGWVSLEVFDFTPGPEKIAKESIATLRKIIAQL
jgi:D-psicose/D-tagatose/L-ribulose 3-epimerase